METFHPDKPMSETRFSQSRLRRPLLWILALAVLLMAIAYTGASAQTGGGYTLSWWTVDTGGQQAALGSGGYTLDSTAGQPDASPIVSTGGRYTLQSGFWPTGRNVYLQYFPGFVFK